MKSVTYVENDLYEFSGFLVTKDSYGYDLKTTDKATDIDHMYSMNFIMMVQNECLSGEGELAKISTDQIVDYYMFRDSPKKDFEKLLEDYEELKYTLGNTGASDRAAETIISYIAKS